MTSTAAISRPQDLLRLFCPEAGEHDPRYDFVREPALWTVDGGKRAILAGDGWIFAWALDPNWEIDGFEEWQGPGMSGYETLQDKPLRWKAGQGICPRAAQPVPRTKGQKLEIHITNYPARVRARDLRRLLKLDSVRVWGLTPRRDEGGGLIGWDWLAWRGQWGNFEFRGLLRCTL